MKAIIVSLSLLSASGAYAANSTRKAAVTSYLNQHFHVSFITENYDLGDIMMNNGLNLRDAYRAAGYDLPGSNLQSAIEACDANQTTVTLRCVEEHLP